MIIGAAADIERAILRVFHHEEEDRTEEEGDGRMLKSRGGTEWKSKKQRNKQKDT